eukprot:NODE_1533_length_1382_cov_14.016504_g1274_i0.p1 GENE.NODE_1533_length_1382_cov_14.016504_g1274_i0~~NODE_1533_length_1382_cov_14.016504_g1274_i0.p1  ORF type:complete len:224 (+),score=13.87 NODE_1533_length_1382_cov_14.016504_g1274_i0:303-974(+)
MINLGRQTRAELDKGLAVHLPQVMLSKPVDVAGLLVDAAGRPGMKAHSIGPGGVISEKGAFLPKHLGARQPYYTFSRGGSTSDYWYEFPSNMQAFLRGLTGLQGPFRGNPFLVSKPEGLDGPIVNPLHQDGRKQYVVMWVLRGRKTWDLLPDRTPGATDIQSLWSTMQMTEGAVPKGKQTAVSDRVAVEANSVLCTPPGMRHAVETDPDTVAVGFMFICQPCS